MDIDITELIKNFLLGASAAAVRVLIAIVILFVSFKLIRAISRRIELSHGLKRADKTVSRIIVYAVSISLRILVILALISFVGIDTGGITALLASLGVGVGLAVNGTLSNLAGGFIIVLTRPFKIDDFISAQGYDGTVEDIRIICTKLVTPDNKVVYIPNGALAGGNILNYSEKKTRRLDLTFSLSSGADIALAVRIAEDVIAESGYFHKEPHSSVRIKDFGESGVTLFLRAWLDGADYWVAYYDITERVFERFASAGLRTPERYVSIRLLENKNDKDGYNGKN